MQDYAVSKKDLARAAAATLGLSLQAAEAHFRGRAVADFLPPSPRGRGARPATPEDAAALIVSLLCGGPGAADEADLNAGAPAFLARALAVEAGPATALTEAIAAALALPASGGRRFIDWLAALVKACRDDERFVSATPEGAPRITLWAFSPDTAQHIVLIPTPRLWAALPACARGRASRPLAVAFRPSGAAREHETPWGLARRLDGAVLAALGRTLRSGAH